MMRIMIKLRWAILAVSVLCLSGCGLMREDGPDTFTPLTNGFGYVTHVHGRTDPSLTQGLWYQDTTGNKKWVWPYLKTVWGGKWGDNLQVSNDLIVLIGEITVADSDGEEDAGDRLIAFQAPSGPPVDISEDVYKRFSTKNDVALTNIVRNTINGLIKSDNGIEMRVPYFKSGGGKRDVLDPDRITFQISWPELEAIVADVRKTGVTKKEKRSGIGYLKKE
jgi:hypothetical protein